MISVPCSRLLPLTQPSDLPQLSEYDLLKLQMLVELGQLMPATVPLPPSWHAPLTEISLLGDVRKKVDPQARPKLAAMTPQEMADYFAENTHCSAIVKVNDDLTELFASHNTWCSYSQLLRLYKTYLLPYKTPGTAADSVMFSGYPGILEGTTGVAGWDGPSWAGSRNDGQELTTSMSRASP